MQVCSRALILSSMRTNIKLHTHVRAHIKSYPIVYMRTNIQSYSNVCALILTHFHTCALILNHIQVAFKHLTSQPRSIENSHSNAHMRLLTPHSNASPPRAPSPHDTVVRCRQRRPQDCTIRRRRRSHLRAGQCSSRHWYQPCIACDDAGTSRVSTRQDRAVYSVALHFSVAVVHGSATRLSAGSD